MTQETIIILVFSTLISIIGFLAVNLLKEINNKLDSISKLVNDHEKRLLIIETQHNSNHNHNG